MLQQLLQLSLSLLPPAVLLESSKVGSSSQRTLGRWPFSRDPCPWPPSAFVLRGYRAQEWGPRDCVLSASPGAHAALALGRPGLVFEPLSPFQSLAEGQLPCPAVPPPKVPRTALLDSPAGICPAACLLIQALLLFQATVEVIDRQETALSQGGPDEKLRKSKFHGVLGSCQTPRWFLCRTPEVAATGLSDTRDIRLGRAEG